jgi:hypothetical protein
VTTTTKGWNGIPTRPIPGQWYRVGEVGVDTAGIMLVDPCYRDQMRDDGNCYDDNGEQVSVTVKTGSDGVYSVFVRYDETLCVSEIRVVTDGGSSRDDGKVPQ